MASAAANAPPVLALSPLAAHSAIAVDRRVDHLRAGRPVEAGPAVADAGEAGTQIDHGSSVASWPSPKRARSTSARVWQLAIARRGAAGRETAPRAAVTGSWPGASPPARRAIALVRSATAAVWPVRKWSAPAMISSVAVGHVGDDRRDDGGWRELVVGGHEDERRHVRPCTAPASTASGGATATRADTAGCSTPSTTPAPNE